MELLAIFFTAYLVGFSGAMAPGPLLTVTIREAMRRGVMAGPLLISGHALLELGITLGLVYGLSRYLASPLLGGITGLAGGILLTWMGLGMVREARGIGLPTAGAPACPGESAPPAAGVPLGTGVNVDTAGFLDPGVNDDTAGFLDPGVNDDTAGFLDPGVTAGFLDPGVTGGPGGDPGAGPAPGVSRLNPVAAGALVSLSNPFFLIWWGAVGAGYVVVALRFGLVGIVFFFLGHILSDFTWYTFVSWMASRGRQRISRRIYQGITAACGIFLVGMAVFFLYSGINFFSGYLLT